MSWHAAGVCALCLLFTGDRAARADSARELPRDNALAAHDTWGPTLRVGTVVGGVHANPVDATALGLVAAGGHRFGRLALESELAMMQLQEQGPSSLNLGRSSRLGVIVRYDVVRFDSRVAGPNTMLAMFVEAGAAQTWCHWREVSASERARVVPEDTQRVEGQGGFGLSVDHRFSQPTGFPNRVAWHLGWRFASPPPIEETYACRGACRLSPTATRSVAVEASVLFESSLAFTW